MKQKVFWQKETCKRQNFYILLAFLLITIELLIDVSNYCYLIKYRAKQLINVLQKWVIKSKIERYKETAHTSFSMILLI